MRRARVEKRDARNSGAFYGNVFRLLNGVSLGAFVKQDKNIPSRGKSFGSFYLCLTFCDEGTMTRSSFLGKGFLFSYVVRISRTEELTSFSFIFIIFVILCINSKLEPRVGKPSCRHANVRATSYMFHLETPLQARSYQALCNTREAGHLCHSLSTVSANGMYTKPLTFM